jgi:hypothetical protein
LVFLGLFFGFSIFFSIKQQLLHLQLQPRISLLKRLLLLSITIDPIHGNDIGWFNIGAYHQGIMSVTTPHLDKLATEGMRFIDQIF